MFKKLKALYYEFFGARVVKLDGEVPINWKGEDIVYNGRYLLYNVNGRRKWKFVGVRPVCMQCTEHPGFVHVEKYLLTGYVEECFRIKE